MCSQPPDAGPCFEYVPRWFFNAQSAQCEQFSYGSCGGNENNFIDRSTCEIKCMSVHSSMLSGISERCTHARDGGSGKEYNVKWYFNVKNLRCEQFVYKGQGGNDNQFETISDCERVCSPQPASIHPYREAIAANSPASSTASNPPDILLPTSDEESVHDNSLTVVDDETLDYNEELSGTTLVKVTAPVPALSNSVDSPVNVEPSPVPPARVNARPPGTEPSPPAAAQAAKTVVHNEEAHEFPAINTKDQKTRKIYKADPIPAKPDATVNEGFPIVGASPPMAVNYQTGEIKNRASGIRTFHESFGGIVGDDSDLTEIEGQRQRLLHSCPNGLQEIRYADGRPVMCLPGKNQCPDKSVCYFNGVDYFCCPNEEDPYDKHVFGGYDGEEVKHGYKVFGPLNVRRLMDEVPLRVRRMATLSRHRRRATDSMLNTLPDSFNIDSIIAPLRFDDKKPHQVSRAQRMRPKPSPPLHGNPICIEPLIKGDCNSTHLRYYYDRDSDTCRLFYYTGCKGNNNNFGSLVDCQRLCVLGGQRSRSDHRSSFSLPPIPPGNCPDGKSPLGGLTPVLCGNSTESIGCPVGYYCLAGPPDVCCPSGKVEKEDENKSIRFAPKQADVLQASRRAFLSTPKYMCPDASDPILSSNGDPIPCGAGFDGVKLCPKGFYCAIDVEKQTRMCCLLYGTDRFSNEYLMPPYMKRSSANPGDASMRNSELLDGVDSSNSLQATVASINKDSNEFDDMEGDDEEEDGEMAHLMIKPADLPQINEEATISTTESNDKNVIETATEPPAVEETTILKAADDKSVCQIKPSEGRTCREDEQPPRTNLHYFYSPKDRRCKLYFYRGCGGNANRFEKKSDCERLCLH